MIIIIVSGYCKLSRGSEFQDSFVRAKSWVKELQRQASPSIVIALAGNKADLNGIRKVDLEVHHCTYNSSPYRNA